MRLLAQFGIRIGPEMGRYVVRQLENSAPGAIFPIVGGDARTGVPILRVIPAAALVDVPTAVAPFVI